MAKPSQTIDFDAIKRAYDGRFDDVSAAVLVVVPPVGRVISVNVEAEELTGFDRAELEAMTLADIFREEDRRRIASVFNSTTPLEFKKLFEHNVIIRKRSQRKIVVDMGFRRSMHAGTPVFVFTLQDITDLKLNEERVLRAHEYVDSIINSIVEVLLVIGDGAEILTVNAAARSLLGYSEDELVGQPLDMVIVAENGVDPATTDSDFEGNLRTKDGRLIPVLASQSEFRSRRIGGRNARAVIVAMDITERKKSELLIAEQQMMLVQASKLSALGEMASAIAHEINNPLQVILGRCEILDMLAQDDGSNSLSNDVLESIKLIDSMSQRISRIVRSLQSLSRDQRQDPAEDRDARAIVRETLILCEQRLRSQVERFEVLLPTEPVLISCRPTEISQVLLNLLNNACDAVTGSADSWIKLWVEVTANEVILVVEDSGHGIPDEVAAKMFAPFFTTKPVGKGTGIGLSVSRSLIERHGGVLSLDRSGPHTRFIVTLPLASAALVHDTAG